MTPLGNPKLFIKIGARLLKCLYLRLNPSDPLLSDLHKVLIISLVRTRRRSKKIIAHIRFLTAFRCPQYFNSTFGAFGKASRDMLSKGRDRKWQKHSLATCSMLMTKEKMKNTTLENCCGLEKPSCVYKLIPYCQSLL